MLSNIQKGWRCRIWLAVFALCLTSNLSPAESGRNFAGSFRISNPVAGEQVVKFQLTVRLCNFSGADINDATVSIAGREPGLPGAEAMLNYQGSFTAVSVRYRKVVILQGAFTVPVLEYQQWQRGAKPNLVVEYANASGEPVRSSVELSHAF